MLKRTLAILALCCLLTGLTACGTPTPTRPPLPDNAEILKRCMGRCQYTADHPEQFVKVEEQTPAQIKQLLPELEGLNIADIAVFKEKEGENAGFYCLIKLEDKEEIPQALEALNKLRNELYPDEKEASIEKWNYYVYGFIGEYGGKLRLYMRQVLYREADAYAMHTWHVDN